MFIIYGLRSYGAVDRDDGGQHATRFVHIYYLPLIPVGGVRISPYGDEQPASMELKSVALAYARFWGFALAIGLSFNAYFELEKSLVSGLAWMAVAAGVLTASLGAWFWAGVRRPNSPLSLGLGFGIPFLVLALMSGSAIKENLQRKASMYSFDSNGAPSPALLELAKAEVEREERAKNEKQEARCAAGEGELCNELGYALSKTNPAGALEYYRKGCDASFGMSCFNLATTLEKSDRKQAVELFDKACKLESKLGCKNLARLQPPKRAKTKRG